MDSVKFRQYSIKFVRVSECIFVFHIRHVGTLDVPPFSSGIYVLFVIFLRPIFCTCLVPLFFVMV